MSGKYSKCPTPECRRLLFRRSNNEFSCGGCKQKFQAEDLIKLEQKSREDIKSEQKNQEEISSNDTQPSINAPSYSRGNRYPNLLERYNKPNPNSTKRGSNLKGSFSSASSISSEGTTIEREQTQNGGNIEENFQPINKMLYGNNYEGSVSSRSFSSDDAASSIHRNPRAMSRRTHKREDSKDSILKYGSNLEEDHEIKPALHETISHQNEPNVMNLHVNKMELRDTSGFDEEIEEREYEKFGLFLSRKNLNPSFDQDDISKKSLNNSRNGERPYKYYSNDEEQEDSKSNYSSKSNPSKIDAKPTERNFLQNPSSVRSSIISEEEIEERETEERERDLTFNQNPAYSRGRRSSNPNSFDGSASSRSFSSDDGGSRIGTGDSRFKSKRTHRLNVSNSTNSSTELNAVENPTLQNNIPNPNHQTELNQVVNELSKFGVTREKLIMLLLQQTDDNNNNNPQNRNQRTLMRKLSFTPSKETPRSTSTNEYEITNRGKRNSLKHHCRPVLGGTPFVICQSCSVLLHLPIGLVKKKLIKIRCGDCDETHVYRFPAKEGPYNPFHKMLGYESARFLMMPSRQFSVMSDDVS